MNKYSNLCELGFSRYEISCYLSLVSRHPVNGSQLSKLSGIARSRIYDVLRNMARKGLVMEVESGLYVPLPQDQLISRLRNQFETNISILEKELAEIAQETTYEYIWVMRGYSAVMDKAREMIENAENELYVRLFPEEGKRLGQHLLAAESRGVGIRYVAMGDLTDLFRTQVVHPDSEKLKDSLGGRSFDIIKDRQEALVGIFEEGAEDLSPINWTRNRWSITANRDSLRHDFYHYFLDKTYDRGLSLTDTEKEIYRFIKSDD